MGTKVPLVDDDNAARDPLAEAMQMMGATMSFPRTSEIFGESEPTDYVYRVVSGSVRHPERSTRFESIATSTYAFRRRRTDRLMLGMLVRNRLSNGRAASCFHPVFKADADRH